MTPQEQKMLDDLMARVDSTRLDEKDPEAAQRIEEWSQRNPDAAYILAQTVLVQSYALEQAKAQIQYLQQQVAQHPALAQQPPKPGSFLGNLFGHKDEGRPQQPAPGYSPRPPPTQTPRRPHTPPHALHKSPPSPPLPPTPLLAQLLSPRRRHQRSLRCRRHAFVPCHLNEQHPPPPSPAGPRSERKPPRQRRRHCLERRGFPRGRMTLWSICCSTEPIIG